MKNLAYLMTVCVAISCANQEASKERQVDTPSRSGEGTLPQAPSSAQSWRPPLMDPDRVSHQREAERSSKHEISYTRCGERPPLDPKCFILLDELFGRVDQEGYGEGDAR